MNSAIFETERYRVHIAGKAAWIETNEGAGWTFCNQHPLPVSLGFDESDCLKAAVTHFEETRRGDSSLRDALTGVRTPHQVARLANAAKPAIAVSKPAQGSPRTAPRAGKTSRQVSRGYFGFRSPVRPPLLSPALAK